MQKIRCCDYFLRNLTYFLLIDKQLQIGSTLHFRVYCNRIFFRGTHKIKYFVVIYSAYHYSCDKFVIDFEETFEKPWIQTAFKQNIKQLFLLTFACTVPPTYE